MTPPTALVTGASRGLGAALAEALNRRGWRLVVDGRAPDRLAAGVAAPPRPALVPAVAGDVADPAHRAALAAAVPGRLELLVNNASELGPTPLPRLADLPPTALERVLAVNTVAPLALVQAVLPALERADGVVLDISSDAAVEAYEGWGGYGASKAALDQLTAVLAAENPSLRLYAVDPGDMNTDMHQAAYPGEDISDRPAPETVVPALLRLLGDDAPPSGRYRAADLVVVNTSGTLPARLVAVRADGRATPLHVSTRLDDGTWVVEVRRPDNTGPDQRVEPGTRLELPGGVRLTLLDGYPNPGAARLWRAHAEPPTDLVTYLQRHGQPIRYGYLHG